MALLRKAAQELRGHWTTGEMHTQNPNEFGEFDEEPFDLFCLVGAVRYAADVPLDMMEHAQEELENSGIVTPEYSKAMQLVWETICEQYPEHAKASDEIRKQMADTRCWSITNGVTGWNDDQADEETVIAILEKAAVKEEESS